MKSRLILGLALASLVLPVSGEQTVYLSSPSDLTLQKGTEAIPALTSVASMQNIWGVSYRNTDDLIYVSNPTDGTILSYEASSDTVVTVISEPTAVFHGIDIADGALYALRSGSDDLVRYDLPSTTPVILANGLMRPCDVVVDSARNRIFVTDSGLDEVREYELDGTLRRLWNLSGVWGVDVSPVDGAVYVSCHDSGELWKNALGSSSFIRVVTGLDSPRGVEVDRSGKIFVLEAGQQRLVQAVPAVNSFIATAYSSEAKNGHGMVVYESTDKDGDYLPDSWELTYNSSLAAVNAQSNNDTDSSIALAEYAFMGSPVATENSLVKDYTQNGADGFSVTIPVVDDADIHPSFMVSNDLVTWIEVAPSRTTAIGGTNYSDQEFELSESNHFTPQKGRLFFKATAEIVR